LLCGRWGLLGGKEEILPEGGRVHEHVRHLMHLLQVTTESQLLRLVAEGHLHELAVDLLIPAVLFGQSFPSD
jgi:hypothetical protein